MNDIKNSFFNLTKNITSKSSDIVKTTKLNVNLINEEENLKSTYIEIGKKVHEIYAYGGSIGPFFDEKFKEIQAIEIKCKELRQQKEQLKGSKTCPKCYKQVDIYAGFCPKCGSDLNSNFEKKPLEDINIQENSSLK